MKDVPVYKFTHAVLPHVFLALISMVPLIVTASEVRTTVVIESAVLSTKGGRLLALPVLSFPPVAKQFEIVGYDSMVGVFEARMDAGVLGAACEGKQADPEDGVWGCAVPAAYIANQQHMHFVPQHWIDSNGRKHATRGGWIFQTGVGGGMGFDLGPSPKQQYGNMVLLSDPGGFPSTMYLSDSDWRRWPELILAVKDWSKRQLVACGSNEKCKLAVSRLAVSNRMEGLAREFKFKNGIQIQLLGATSKSVGPGVLAEINKSKHITEVSTEPDTLVINLWRTVASDGTTRILRVNRNSFSWLNGTVELLDPYCSSQCEGGWTQYPELFAVSGRIFAYGAYHTGTVNGYLFLEVLPTELKLLGWYRWGS